MSSTVKFTEFGTTRSGDRGDKILRITSGDLFKMAERETTVFIGEERLKGWVVPPPVFLANDQLASPRNSDRWSQEVPHVPNQLSSRHNESQATTPQMYMLHFCADRKLVKGNCGRIIYVKNKRSKECYRVGMLVGRVRACPNIYQAVILCHNIASLIERYRKISGFNLIDERDKALEPTGACRVDDLVARSEVERLQERCEGLPISQYRESEEDSGIQSAEDRKSTRLNSSHVRTSRMPSSA